MSEESNSKKPFMEVIGATTKGIGFTTNGKAEPIDSPDDGKDPAAKALGRKGGTARAARMTPEQRTAAARKAATKRWEAKKGSYPIPG